MRELLVLSGAKIQYFNDLSNKKILILDDIVTTGATLREIKSSILRQFDNKDKKNGNNIKITVFCLAAAREIKVNRGEI